MTTMTVTLRIDATAGGAELRLRPWADADAESLVEIHRDPAMRRWVRQSIEDTADALEWLEIQHRGWRTGERLCFAVGEPLSACVVLKRRDPDGDTAAVGYWTAPAVRGRGIAVLATDALSRWAFDTFPELTRLELRHELDNHPSCRVAEKLGFPLERVIPAEPPFPQDGHLHTRHRTP
jgi:RimJ/RimL family protein N-acetyltransferase